MKSETYLKYYRSSLYFPFYNALLLIVMLLNISFKGLLLNNAFSYLYFSLFFVMELPAVMNFGISNQMTRHQIAKAHLKQISIAHLWFTLLLPLTLVLFNSPFKFNLLYIASFFVYLTFNKIFVYVLILIISLIQDANVGLIIVTGMIFVAGSIGGFVTWWNLGDAALPLLMQILLVIGLIAVTAVMIALYNYLMTHVSVYAKSQK